MPARTSMGQEATTKKGEGSKGEGSEWRGVVASSHSVVYPLPITFVKVLPINTYLNHEGSTKMPRITTPEESYPADGLSVEEARQQWRVVSSSILLHKSYLPVPNLIYDAVAAVIPLSDMAVFMYLYRRVMGYTNEDELPQAVVTYEHFSSGRKARDGRPIDFGCGLVVSTIQESLERLTAARMVVMVKRGKGGRFATGSTWTIGEGSEWTFAPFYETMTYGQLGRFVNAAKWGKLAPPRSLKEAKQLEKAIKNKRASSHKTVEILMPAEWFEGTKTASQSAENDSVDADSIVPLSGTTILPLRSKTSYRSGVMEEGVNPHSSKENSVPKDTIRKTLIKDTSLGTSPAAGPNGEKAKQKNAELSLDGQTALEWQENFIQHCYEGRVPGEWKYQTASLKELRLKYPLAVVLDYYDYWKHKPTNADRTNLPRWIARDIISWPGLDESLRDWERSHPKEDAATPDVAPAVDVEQETTQEGVSGNGGTTILEGVVEGDKRSGEGVSEAARDAEQARKRSLQERINALGRVNVAPATNSGSMPPVPRRRLDCAATYSSPTRLAGSFPRKHTTP